MYFSGQFVTILTINKTKGVKKMNNAQKKKNTVRFLAEAGVIAAMYVALTYLSNALGLAYNAVQFRISEMLCILALYTPAAIPGLTIGCIIANITSPFGFIDIAAGSLASFCAALLIYLTRHVRIKRFAPGVSIFPALLNGVVVGAEIWYLAPDRTPALFAISALEVAAGEIVVCTAAAILLPQVIERTKIFPTRMKG